MDDHYKHELEPRLVAHRPFDPHGESIERRLERQDDAQPSYRLLQAGVDAPQQQLRQPRSPRGRRAVFATAQRDEPPTLDHVAMAAMMSISTNKPPAIEIEVDKVQEHSDALLPAAKRRPNITLMPCINTPENACFDASKNHTSHTAVVIHATS